MDTHEKCSTFLELSKEIDIRMPTIYMLVWNYVTIPETCAISLFSILAISDGIIQSKKDYDDWIVDACSI